MKWSSKMGYKIQAAGYNGARMVDQEVEADAYL
jgi:hypothetical protein